MPLEIGSIVEGKVVKITKFGAFVELQDGSQGLIHISQIANQFIKDVSEYLKINDIVKVKILSKDEKGYFELSMKEVQKDLDALNKKDAAFEEKLAIFLKKSEERLLDLKRNLESKRSGGGRIKYY
jgi:S1 RNA binding domain protein